MASLMARATAALNCFLPHGGSLARSVGEVLVDALLG